VDASGAIRPVALEGKEAEADNVEKLVHDEDLAAAVIVPAGYSDKLLAGDLIQLVMIVDAGKPAGLTAQGEIQAAALRLAGAAETARLSARATRPRPLCQRCRPAAVFDRGDRPVDPGLAGSAADRGGDRIGSDCR